MYPPLLLLLVVTAAASSILTFNTTGYSLSNGQADFARIFLPITVMFRLAVILAIFFSIDALRRTPNHSQDRLRKRTQS
jgi:drug/metabolite transporter (DMT)-like permease